MIRKPGQLALFAVVLLAALLVVPVPVSGRATSALMDLAHAPAFAALALLLCRAPLRRWPRSLPNQLLGIALPLAACGAMAEWLQAWVKRGPSWHDAAANALGAVAGVLLHQALRRQTEASEIEAQGHATGPRFLQARLLAAAALALVVLAEFTPSLVLWDCWRQRRDFPQLASFTSRWELSRFREVDARLRRVPDPANPGGWRMRVDLLPGEYPGVQSYELPLDWSAYKWLAFDVTVDAGPPLDLIVKVYDVQHRLDGYEGDDRFDGHFRLSGGPHAIRIPLDQVAAAPSGRKMDLSQIESWQVFTYRLAAPRTIWIGNLRLE